jgi:N6-adenosine-specific RNA methylase IME4
VTAPATDGRMVSIAEWPPPIPFRLGGWPVIAADPPWAFQDAGTRLAPDYAGDQRAAAGGAELYQTMPLAAIERLPVSPADDAVLFLWCPNVLVLEGVATRVARSWGFEPKQLVPWVKTDAAGKPRLGGGHYTRVVTEQLIVCTRGSVKVLRRDVPGVIFAPRGRHSAKPDRSYQMIEELVRGPYLELFARRRYSPAWTCWGDQAPPEAT